MTSLAVKMKTIEDFLRLQVVTEPGTTHPCDLRIKVEEVYPDRGVRVSIFPADHAGEIIPAVILDDVCVSVRQGDYLRSKGK